MSTSIRPYSREDIQTAWEIYNFLLNNGCLPWIDVHNINPGQDWEMEIRQSIQCSDYFLACLSRKSVSKRGFVQKELKFALSVLDEIPDGEIYIIPIRLEECEVPFSLRNRQWLDWFSSESKKRLLEAIGMNKIPSTKDELHVSEHQVSNERVQQLNRSKTQAEDSAKLIEPVILVVDDDLSIEAELFKQLENIFADHAKVQLISDPKAACNILSHQRNILGCITDIVFRNYSSLAGVEVAEAAMRNNVSVVAVTGHRRTNMGLALDEFERIGLSKRKILTKPVTYKQYQSFLEQIRGWIIGFNVQ